MPLDSNTGSSAVVEGNRAYLGTFDNEVVAVDLARAEDRVALPAIPIASSRSTRRRRWPAARVIVGGRDKAVHAIDAATGKSAWKFVTRARVDSSPAIAGGRVFVGSSDGKLYVLDARPAQKKWEFDAGDALTASPAIAGGRIVIGSQDGRLYCFG